MHRRSGDVKNDVESDNEECYVKGMKGRHYVRQELNFRTYNRNRNPDFVEGMGSGR